MMLAAASCVAQEPKPAQWFQNVKLSGYGLVQYQASGKKGDKSNSFDLRLVRLSLDGRIQNDFYWKAQVQSVLLSEDMNAWYEELTAGYTAEQQSGIRYVG